MKSLEEQIEDKTKLIKELENKKVPYDNSKGRWHESNIAYETNYVSIRDAYWKRRMLIAKLEGLDTNETAKVY
jgi:hypothetical protein